MILLTMQAVLHLYLKSDGKLSKVCISCGFTEPADPLLGKFESANARPPLNSFIFASHIKHEIKPLFVTPPPLAHSGQKNETLPPKIFSNVIHRLVFLYSYQMDSANVRSFLILPKGMRSGGDSTKAANN